MIIGITAIVLTFIYFLIVSIIYFKKNRVKNLDNRVFSILCILNLIGLLLELSCYYLVVNREKYLVLNEVVNRLFLIYIICWSFTLIEYEFKVIYKDNKKVQNIIINHSFLPKIVYTVMLLLTIFLTLITELNYFNDGKFVYSYGKATDIVFTPCIISFLIGSISIIINRKHINFQVMIKNQKNIIFALSMNFQLLKKLLNICH